MADHVQRSDIAQAANSGTAAPVKSIVSKVQHGPPRPFFKRSPVPMRCRAFFMPGKELQCGQRFKLTEMLTGLTGHYNTPVASGL